MHTVRPNPTSVEFEFHEQLEARALFSDSFPDDHDPMDFIDEVPSDYPPSPEEISDTLPD